MRTMTRRQLLLIAFMAAVFALIGAIVGLLVTSSGSGSPTSLRNLTLQPSDLPSDFVLIEEKLYSREELLAELPAESQITEAGLQEADHVSYESPGDVPMIIDVFVYTYEDEAAAKTAHTYLRESDWNQLFRRVSPESDWQTQSLSGGVVESTGGLVEGMGDDAFWMTGEMASDADSSVPVNVYFMHSGNARAQIIISGKSVSLNPDTVARNQYLRLQRPEAVAAP
jgi:hypothetical protein